MAIKKLAKPNRTWQVQQASMRYLKGRLKEIETNPIAPRVEMRHAFEAGVAWAEKNKASR